MEEARRKGERARVTFELLEKARKEAAKAMSNWVRRFKTWDNLIAYFLSLEITYSLYYGITSKRWKVYVPETLTREWLKRKKPIVLYIIEGRTVFMQKFKKVFAVILSAVISTKQRRPFYYWGLRFAVASAFEKVGVRVRLE